MHPGGATELIWHFAGYIHLTTELTLPRIKYDLGGSYRTDGDFATNRIDAAAAVADFELDESFRSRGLITPDDGSPMFHGAFQALKFGSGKFEPIAPPAKYALPPGPHAPPALIGGGGGHEVEWPDITVEYCYGAPQRLIYSEQIKFMFDNDRLLGPDGFDPGDPHTIDIAATMDSMIDAALARSPDDLDIPLQNQNATAEFFGARDAALAEAGPPQEPSVANGLWIDDELQPAGTEHPELPPAPEFVSELPGTDGTVSGLSATLGANVQANLAQIIDLNEAAQTVVVLGDYFETNAIVQFNVYHDDDQVTAAGPVEAALAAGGVNDAKNIAEFLSKEAFPGGGPHAFAGPNWHVDILDGDFLDVKTLVQQNWMIDNDLTSQTTSGAYYRVLAGGNEQIALSSYFDLKHYDVIIVLGDYHEANIVFQKNFLLDDDILQVAADLGPGHDGFAQQLTWNGNTLLNDATITNLGVQHPGAVTDSMMSLVELLGEGTTTDLDSSYGWMFSGNGSGRLDILYVTGDYYDVNVAMQMNVLSDADTAMQLLPDVTPPRDAEREEGEEALEQSASTGGNTLTNFASIVDVGALVDHQVGGDYYRDTILIQENIAVSDEDDVLISDTGALVPELVAFTGLAEEEPPPEIAPVKDILQQSDQLGSILT